MRRKQLHEHVSILDTYIYKNSSKMKIEERLSKLLTRRVTKSDHSTFASNSYSGRNATLDAVIR